MQSYRVHMQNRFPGARIEGGPSHLSAWSAQGELLCTVVRDGNGAWVCGKKDSGAKFAWSLDPLPKNTRAMKLYADGSVAPAEEYKERLEAAKKFESAYGYVPSIAECRERGLKTEGDSREPWNLGVAPAAEGAKASK